MTHTITVGSQIETREFNGIGTVWVKRTITKVLGTFVWFLGSGYQRIKITTLFKFPELYRVL